MNPNVKVHSRKCFLFALALAGIGTTASHAQELTASAFSVGPGTADPLTFSRTSDNLLSLRRKYREEQPYNLRMGPVNLSFSASATAEYIDNINLTEKSGIRDFAVGPDAKVNALWVISEQNALSLDAGFGYRYYFHEPSVSSAVLAPNSNLSYDISVGHFLFDIHNRATYSYDPITVGAINNLQQFGRISNVSGLTAYWDSGDLRGSLGYDHEEFFTTSTVLNYLNHSSDVVFGTLGYSANDSNILGVEAGGTWISYSKSVLNNGTVASGGPFWKSKISNHIDTEVRAGLTRQSFGNSGTVGDNRGYTGYYAQALIRHTVSSSLSHELQLSRTLDLGTASNFIELYTVRDDLRWAASDKLVFTMPLGFEYGKESNFAVGGEKFDRWIVGAGASYPLSAQTTASLNYLFATKDSRLYARDYTQNRISLTISHQF